LERERPVSPCAPCGVLPDRLCFATLSSGRPLGFDPGREVGSKACSRAIRPRWARDRHRSEGCRVQRAAVGH